MKKKIISVLFIVAIILALPSGVTFADGGFFGQHGNDIYEPEQKAVIFFHQGTEEMVLSVSYDGAPAEFAWLVPTPQPPKIDESNILLFEMMSVFTPEETDTMGGVEKGYWNGTASLNGGVDILSEQTTGPFDLTVVRSTSAGDLEGWLNDRGFSYDSRAESVLSDYIERGWCFTAMRINPSFLVQGGASDQLSEGTIAPLRFTFSAEEPVFPLYISSLNPGGAEVLIYLLGSEPYVHQAMSLEYAETWKPEQINALAGFSQLATKMGEAGGCHLTKLRCNFPPQEMQDLYFTPADEKTRNEWPGLGNLGVASGTKDDGTSFPWWELLASALIIAAIIAAISGPSGHEKKSGFMKRALVFLAAGLIVFTALLPLGLLISDSEKKNVAVAKAFSPWSDDILLNRNGWSVLAHPDGSSEIIGLEEGFATGVAAWEAGPQETEPFEHFTGDELALDTGKLEGEGDWTWSVLQHRDQSSQTISLEVSNLQGETHRAVLDSMYVHTVRRSLEGDRLWVVLNPGVPVNTTEVREYAFPSLELTSSVIHEDCMEDGKIVVSADGKPLLAGHFTTGDGLDERYGFLPLLESGAGYEGECLEIIYEDHIAELNEGTVTTMGYGYSDAVDGSPFMLLSGFPNIASQSFVMVLDTRDGKIYKVCEGTPIGWQ